MPAATTAQVNPLNSSTPKIADVMRRSTAAALRGDRQSQGKQGNRSSFDALLIRKPGRSSLNPLVDEGEPGYIPTIQVIALVRSNFHPTYIRRQVARNLNPAVDVDELDRAVAVEIACRELLASQRWLYSNQYD